MTNFSKKLAIMLACMFAGCVISAQEADFDLSAQRSESQNIPATPGQKIDHKGIIVNPTPQEMSINRNKTLDITKGIALKDIQNKFSNDLGFTTLNKKGIKMSVNFGSKVAAKAKVKAISGAYSLTINKNGISIIGYDEAGAFYGIQTLRQLIESPATEGVKLPYLTINDFPNLPNRGVVEGFYGNPWSHEVRMSLIDFYGKFKMNTYVFGPKDDKYHSCPNWRLPYPEKEAANISELIKACKKNRVDFVWAIHPGQDIKWNEEDYNNLVNKFNWMYDLGVRSFAIFFDDISGEGTNPLKQTELLNRLTDEFVKAKGDVTPLTVCPTDYTKLWANPTPQGSLVKYGETLNPDIKVFWTGDVVCSDLTKETLDWVNSRIKRPSYYWWNYPVTDYVRHILMQGPVYGLNTSLTANDVCGVLSNPMEHGEASKLALYGVADYTWNIAAYNPIDNWERGLVELASQGSDAYRTFAIHSCDTETGYRRAESWETQTFRIANWNEEAAQALRKEFEKIEATPSLMEATSTNEPLMRELRPWLTEFSKLGTRGKRLLDIAEIYRSGNDDAAFWNNYVGNLMTPEDRKAYNAHKSGTMKLQPFYENAMDDMAFGFLKKLIGQTPKEYRGIGSFANSNGISTKLMFDNDTVSYYTSGISQKAGDWIGVDLRDVREVSNVSILQGRNSINDVDFFDHAVVEYSADGKSWKPLTEELTNQYVINWSGEPVKARYIRIKRLESKRRNYASVRSFKVNNAEAAHCDFNTSTYTACNGSLTIDVPQGTKGYTLLLNKIQSPATLCQLNSNGTIVSETTIYTPFTKISLKEGVSQIKIGGNVDIFEIIPQTL